MRLQNTRITQAINPFFISVNCFKPSLPAGFLFHICPAPTDPAVRPVPEPPAPAPRPFQNVFLLRSDHPPAPAPQKCPKGSYSSGLPLRYATPWSRRCPDLLPNLASRSCLPARRSPPITRSYTRRH